MLISAFGLHPCGADLRSVCAAGRCSHPSERLQAPAAEWRMGRDCLRCAPAVSLRSARTANVDFGLRPSPLRGRPAVGLCRGAALFIPPRGLPALRFGCLVPEVRDSAQAPTAIWRMGRDWSPEATCLTARTANVDFGLRPSPLRGRPAVGLCRGAALSSLSEFQAAFGRWRMGRDSNPRCIAAHTLSKRAHSTTLPPILEQQELNTMVGRAARRQQAFARFAVQALMAVMGGGQRCCRVRFTV